MHASQKRPQGFTLVELIVTIVIAGFLGMLLVNMLGTQLLRSSTPVLSASNAARAETTMEMVTAYYTQCVNNSTSGALNAVVAKYPNNATFTATRNNNFNSVDALIVTVTEGDTSLTTILTQERTSSADNATTF